MAKILKITMDISDEEHLELQKVAMRKLAENISNQLNPEELKELIRRLKSN